MPEYLAPGVYVEEIDTGSKPIEGVSTSTAGMVGVTERGPLDVPILITGFAEYQRWFGGYLRRDLFSNGTQDPHCYLPHAVEGFFTNGGKRLYVVRVQDKESGLATRAAAMLFDRGRATSAATVLLRPTTENTGTAINPPLVLVLSGQNLAQNDFVRIGDGSDAEYRRLTTAPAPETVLVPLAFPLSRSHGGGAPATVEQIARNAGTALTLTGAIARGEQTIEVRGAQAADVDVLITTPPAVPPLLEIGPQDQGEHRFVTQATRLSPTSARVRLDSPLVMPYPDQSPVTPLTIPAGNIATAQLDPVARAGDSLLYVNNRGGDFDTRTDLALIDRTDNSLREVRRIGQLRRPTLAAGATDVYPAGTVVEAVDVAETNRLTLTRAQAVNDTTIQLSDVSTLVEGQELVIGTGGGRERVTVLTINAATREVTLAAALTSAKQAGNPVADDNHPTLDAARNAGQNTLQVSHVGALIVGQTLRVGTGAGQETVVVAAIDRATRTLTLAAALAANKAIGAPVVLFRALTAGAAAGATAIALDNRIGLREGEALRIGEAASEEFVTIAGLPNRAPVGVAPDAGTVLLGHPLVRAHDPATDRVLRLTPILRPNVQPSVLSLGVEPGEYRLLVSDGGGNPGYPANSVVRLTIAGGATFFHRITATTAAPGNPGVLAPQMVTLDAPLGIPHPIGAPVAERRPLFEVVALDTGSWGDRLRVSIEDEAPGLVATTEFRPVAGQVTLLRLASTTGVEAGTVLEVVHPITGAVVDPLLKVVAVNRGTGEVTLAAPGLDAAHQAAIDALLPRRMGVRSREFRLTVRLLRQPDPALPSRNDLVLDTEVFRWLSMDPRHSRYLHRIVGTTWNPAAGTAIDGDGRPLRRADRRSEGESWYVRVRDQAANQAAAEASRLGPETLLDLLPSGVLRAARHPLAGGGDAIAQLDDDDYEGDDDPEPERRTGLASLRNEEEIAIVAVPGRTSTALQGSLIAHCELLRYRFAVLDGPLPPSDSLNDVQFQRQQFDTKYAGLYHPWLLIPDPYPANLAQVADYPIPPSGHVAGVYARTDVERGVHKAPANEVVRGVIGLQRSLNKGEQDILNPSPVNINVIRDFRLDNRGIRVYGGRVITSDPDWKYVNVRRLLIFIENSLDRGLQWVVFEPNAEPLWARVRRSIGAFLTVVWRNGALEGTTREEAYFVKCDRTTMTQADIDNGRLIVIIGVAPVKPAEFVIIRIGLWTAHAEEE